MKTRILLTGFTRFLDFRENPTEELMKRLSQGHNFPGAEIRTRVLEVNYGPAEEAFLQELSSFKPHGVILFGLNFRIDHIALERIAVNIDDAGKPDNTGTTRTGSLIAEDGPVAYWTTLPVREMEATLRKAEIPVKISNHAGAYLCNHLFYHGLHTIHRLKLEIPLGFIHVPPFPGQLENPPASLNMELKDRKGMELDTLHEAAGLCIQLLIDHIGTKTH